MHESLPVHGVQFHPESIASEHGHLLLKNFLDLAAAWNAKAGRAKRAAHAARTWRGTTMADEFKALIAKVATGASLTREEAASAFDRMMSGEATPSQMGALLMALARARRNRGRDHRRGHHHARQDAGREGAARRHRRGRHRRRCLRLVQHFDLRGLHRGGRRRAGRQARQSRAVVEIGRRRRAAGARRQDRSQRRAGRRLHPRGRHRLHVRAERIIRR